MTRSEDTVPEKLVPSPSFIPRDADEYPSQGMPSPGHADWREEAEWWQHTCEYWRKSALGEPT